MRKIDSNGPNSIVVMDEPGPGNVCHEYQILRDGKELCVIKFQRGPAKENGEPGVTELDLLEILLDRFAGYQSGPYRCRETACAATKTEEALMWLMRRRDAREKRGVLGTSAV